MSWLERYFFKPSLLQKIIIFTLLPISLLYALISLLNTLFRKKVSFDLPIISVGNLSFGGNGKTPVCKAIASLHPGCFVVLRGYKRKSKGLKVVKHNKQILCSYKHAGDEAYEYALCDDVLGVIVSKDRVLGIKKARELGAKIILLDDAFSKFYILKFDLLLFSSTQPKYPFCPPSGCLRLPPFCAKRANFLAYEGEHFLRYSNTKENQKAILISTVAKPFRLYEHFGKARACYFFKDHETPSKEHLQSLLLKHNCDTLMLTMKDYVKVKDYGFKTQLITLKIVLLPPLANAINQYIKEKNDNNPSKACLKQAK